MLCCGMLFIVLTTASAYPRRSCSGAKPVDLLGGALSEKLTFPTGVEVVTSEGVRGYRFSKQAVTFGVRSEILLGKCATLPPEYSFQINFKHPAPRNRYEYLLTLLAQDQRSLLLAIRLRRNSVCLEYIRKNDRRLESVPFSSNILDDGEWHNLVISVAGNEAKFTLDCDRAVIKKLDHGFAANVDLRKTRFFIGSKRQKRKRFTGILRQMVFVPGADASNLICPSAHPSLAALEQGQPRGSRVAASMPVIFEMDRPYVSCSVRYEGRLLFADDSTLKVCRDGEFKRVKAYPPRLDYLTYFDNFETPNGTVDIETFYIPDEGHFLATANGGSLDSSKSAIFKWNGAKYVKYQAVPSKEAQDWKHFTIGDEHFLALANSGKGKKNSVKSVIFRWLPRKRKFGRHQLIRTYSARSWEAFVIDGMHYLVVANYMDDSKNRFNLCELFVWNPDLRLFTPQQKLPSVGANDVEFFQVEAGGRTFSLLVIANTLNIRSSRVNSTIFYWEGGRFNVIQNIETMGALDWEAFKIDGVQYLAVANSFMLGPGLERNFAINSSIYELNYVDQTFVKIQDIVTYGARDWEFFTIGDQSYLVVSNLEKVGGSYRTVVYRWQGVERFVPIHDFVSTRSADFEHVAIDGEHYLAMAGPDYLYSKLYKIITY